MTTTIPIKKEDHTIGPPFEQCCSCGKHTPWWTDLPDRKPGEQVALCPECATQVDAKDRVTKAIERLRNETGRSG